MTTNFLTADELAEIAADHFDLIKCSAESTKVKILYKTSKDPNGALKRDAVWESVPENIEKCESDWIDVYIERIVPGNKQKFEFGEMRTGDVILYFCPKVRIREAVKGKPAATPDLTFITQCGERFTAYDEATCSKCARFYIVGDCKLVTVVPACCTD